MASFNSGTSLTTRIGMSTVSFNDLARQLDKAGRALSVWSGLQRAPVYGLPPWPDELRGYWDEPDEPLPTRPAAPPPKKQPERLEHWERKKRSNNF